MATRSVLRDETSTVDLDIGTCVIGKSFSLNSNGGDGRKGENPYSITVVESNNPACTIYEYPETIPDFSRTSGVFEAIGHPVGRFDEAAYSNKRLKKLQDLVSKVRQHDWNFAVDLAEGNQTAALAVTTVRRLSRSFRSLRARDLSGATRHLFSTDQDVLSPKAYRLMGKSSSDAYNDYLRAKPKRLSAKSVSGQWLELQYAWLPLMSSVYEATRFFARSQQKEQRFRVRGSLEGEFAIGNSAITSQGSSRARRRFQYIWIVEGYRGTTLDDLGFANPLLVAWEKVPFSFVVDWFLPIGTYLDVSRQVSLVVGKEVYTESTELSYTGTPSLDSSKLRLVGGSGLYYRSFSQTRSVNAIASTNVPLPKLVNGLHGRRVFSAVALAHQLLRR